jgi:hypothetical protein
MPSSIGPWQSGQERSERLLREAERDRLLAAAGGERSTAAERVLGTLGTLLLALGRRLARVSSIAAHEDRDNATHIVVPGALQAAQRVTINGAALASLRGELLASEFSDAATSAVVVVRMELAPDERVAVYCWDSDDEVQPAEQAERRVALFLSAPRASVRQ